jgi:hypothetical protein
MKPLMLILFLPIAIFGQEKKEIVSLRAGYSGTIIVFKEAVDPSFLNFGITFNDSKTFIGSGPEFGVSKSINDDLFIDCSFSTFSGKHTKFEYGQNKFWYSLKGYQIPLTINYLLRKNTKKLRINLGGGLQYLKANLKQYETVDDGAGDITYQRTDINIGELQFLARPGLQYRIVPNLFAAFVLNLSVSTSGRFVDHPSIFLTYRIGRNARKG